MSLSIDSLSQYNNNLTTASAKSTKTDKLSEALSNTNTDSSSDKELMQVCKQFESYLVEQVFKSMKTTVPKSEDDENEYMQYFGDTLYQEYADGLAENGSLGIAQTLFDSMRRK